MVNKKGIPTSKTEQQLRSSILEAVDYGLSVLGEGGKYAFYHHLLKLYGIKRGEIPDNIAQFNKSIIDMFREGSPIIEQRISKHIFEKMGLNLGTALGEHDTWSLNDYIEYAKKNQS
jgi:hypothetical protein